MCWPLNLYSTICSTAQLLPYLSGLSHVCMGETALHVYLSLVRGRFSYCCATMNAITSLVNYVQSARCPTYARKAEFSLVTKKNNQRSQNIDIPFSNNTPKGILLIRTTRRALGSRRRLVWTAGATPSSRFLRQIELPF